MSVPPGPATLLRALVYMTDRASIQIQLERDNTLNGKMIDDP